LLRRRNEHVARGVSNAHPLFAERAHGARVWDVEGREYFDFMGGIGVQNVGHTHPKIVAAVQAQAARLMHTCFQTAMYEPYLELAERLNGIAPGPSVKKTLLLTTGAEATENAVKIAREYTRRPAVIAFRHGYHGRTLLALSMTGKDEPYKQHFGPFCTDVYHAPFPHDLHGCTVQRALDELQRIFDVQVPADRVAAIIIEPVLGEGGFVPAPAAFLQELRRIADRHGIVLICDEVQTGFGRTGKMFACEHSGVEPDLIAVAKSIAGGLPLSAVIGKAHVMDAPEPGGLGGTYAGNPIACAAALATLDIIDEAFLARARQIGEAIARALDDLRSRFDAIVETRGVGAMRAMEFAHAEQAAGVVAQARERGLLLLLAGNGNVIRILVPLTIGDADLNEALSRLANSCEATLRDSPAREGTR
jgi:4-aminobutyrate aminotransferase/(S)-3-amino-2-methylpropionate transaminase